MYAFTASRETRLRSRDFIYPTRDVVTFINGDPLVPFTFPRHSRSRIKLRSPFFLLLFFFNNRDAFRFFFSSFRSSHRRIIPSFSFIFFYSYDFETSKFLISLFPEYFFSNDLIRFYRINIYRTFSPNSPPCIKNHEYFTTILFPSLNLHKLAHARSTREIKIGINFSFDSFFFFFCANFPTLGGARH